MADITKACRDIGELKPIAQKACNLFMNECKKKGIDIFITETYRSQERQNYIYEQGRSRGGNIVTWTKKSNHTGRMAWDIACNGKALYDNGVLIKAGQVAKELGITWGGSWSTPDKPHFEVTADWKEPKEEYNVNKIEICLNNKIKTVEAINKDGFNYVKLRDLADEKIYIGYDSQRDLPVVEIK